MGNKQRVRVEKTYEVGYKRPPANTQFKPGQSGNPNGRPKGTFSIDRVVERMSREKVTIRENGKTKTVTKLEAAVRQFWKKAASGDLRAFHLLTVLARYAEARTAHEGGRNNLVTDENDQRVIADILKTFHSNEKE